MQRAAIALVVTIVALVWAGSAWSRCVSSHADAAYTASVQRALRSGWDVWGNRLLAAKNGPTYAGAARYLKPLLLAGAPHGKGATRTGVHYLVFGRTAGGYGADSVALHVADGSELISERTDGPSLTISVGDRTLAPYGSCIARLSTPHLYDGYLPILQNEYADSDGTLYEHESFATRLWGSGTVISFVRLTVDTRGSKSGLARVVLTPSARGLRLEGNRLVSGGKTFLVLGEGASFDGRRVTFTAGERSWQRFYFARVVTPTAVAPAAVDGASYARARDELASFWNQRLGIGTQIDVPEQRVLDAERSLLVQNTLLSWRYSVGNTYEDFSVPEAVDAAGVMGEYGFQSVDRAILQEYFWTRFRDSHWKLGEILLGIARYVRLFHDRPYLDAVTPALSAYVAQLGDERARSGRGTLGRAPYSSDVGARVYGLHSQAVVWDGLRSIAAVWAEAGRPELAARAQRIAARLGAALRAAVHESQQRLKDGSLFVPVRLFEREAPYAQLTASRAGSYWNLVAPYALATGLLPPHGAQAAGVLRYLLRHGSRILGLVRAGVYAIYRKPRFPVSGSDQVYGVNVARFLADNDQADQLVLSLYGQLAAGMTERTFVAGEGATIAPFRGEYYRRMYLPPNSGANSAYLETLRLMLLHETRDGRGRPRGLELAFATPRPWLSPGKRISVGRAPTSFGLVSYSIDAADTSVEASIDVPQSRLLHRLRLRLRLPDGRRIKGVTVGGRPYRRFDPSTGTIDLSGLRGSLSLDVATS